jgi:hypothetical protein
MLRNPRRLRSTQERGRGGFRRAGRRYPPGGSLGPVARPSTSFRPIVEGGRAARIVCCLILLRPHRLVNVNRAGPSRGGIPRVRFLIFLSDGGFPVPDHPSES